MLFVGIKDLKDNLSRYLTYVKRGEDIYITERGKVIVRIMSPPPLEVPGKPVSEMAIEDRR